MGGFVRLRADEVLSPRGKVPKGRRGRPKGACGVAAPGPPVAKLQCTASLAGARPAGFTSVPGRATVAFGAADPSPGSWAPVYPWSVGKGPPRQCHLAAVRAPAPGPCKVRAHHCTRLVAGPRPNQMACPIRTLSVERQEDVPLPVQGGSGGIPRPFEGGIGGPGGIGGRSESPLPPWPAEPRSKRKIISQNPVTNFPLLVKAPQKICRAFPHRKAPVAVIIYPFLFPSRRAFFQALISSSRCLYRASSPCSVGR